MGFLKRYAWWLLRPDFSPIEVTCIAVIAWTVGKHPRWIVSQVLLLALIMTGGRFLRRHDKEPHGDHD